MVVIVVVGVVKRTGRAPTSKRCAAIEREKFEVAIIDSVMPNEDGIALTVKIRATKAGQKLPILIMSALSTALARRMAKNAGANEFLPKPFSPTQLLEQVRSITRS